MSNPIRTKVAGVTYSNEYPHPTRQEIIAFQVDQDSELRFIREPLNKYDPSAIAVYVLPNEKNPWGHKNYQIGYLGGRLAEELAPELDAGYVLIGKVLEKTGGGNGQAYGVNIEIELTALGDPRYVNFDENDLRDANPTKPSRLYATTAIPTGSKKPKKMTFWRALFGLAFLFTAVIGFRDSYEFGMTIMVLVLFLTPAIILLWPWLISVGQKMVNVFQTMNKKGEG